VRRAVTEGGSENAVLVRTSDHGDLDLVDLIVGVESGQSRVESSDQRVPARVAGDPPSPVIGDPMKDRGESVTELAGVRGDMQTVEDPLEIDVDLLEFGGRGG
jgi:hypothetical protein